MKGFLKGRSLPDELKTRLMVGNKERGKILAHGLQRALPAIVLTSQSVFITAFANDIDRDLAFAQQVLG